MVNEASKTKSLWDDSVLQYLKGDGIDIGCGKDPVLPGVDRFDVEDGDANFISKFVSKKYDFVFSSHSLEHMHDPFAALKEWFSLLKKGGTMVIVVPDEDLYEQGIFPSIFNPDHKRTFTISKQKSWSPFSVNILDLVRSIDGELVSIQLQDVGLDRGLLSHGAGPMKIFFAKCYMRFLGRFRPVLPQAAESFLARTLARVGIPIDQTCLLESRMAQIQFIVRKPQ